MISATIYCLLFLMLFGFVYVYMYMTQAAANGIETNEAGSARLRLSLLALLGAGLAIRLVIAYNEPGHTIDVPTFQAWASHAATAGIAGFYTADMFVDYPPGYIYVLYAVGWLRQFLQLPYDSPLFVALLKSPAIAADIAASYLLFRFGLRYAGVQAAFGCAVLYLFNPAIIVNSAAWGQVDSFFMLWMLVCLEAIVSRKLRLASVIYATALLIKPQALLFGPLLLFWFIRRGDWRLLLQCFGLGLATFAALIVPFIVHKEPLWIFTLYFGTLSSYPYASLNASNVMSLFGGNFISMDEPMLGFTFRTWGTMLFAAVLAYAAYLFFKSKKDDAQLAIIACVVAAGAFMTLVKMHERYLFYALPLLVAGFLHSRDRRLLGLFAAFSLTCFINVYDVLFKSYEQVYHLAPDDYLLWAVSFANVVLYIALCAAAWRLIVRGRSEEMGRGALAADAGNGTWRSMPPHPEANAQTSAARQADLSPGSGTGGGWLRYLPRWRPLSWTRTDTLLLAGLTIGYTVLAFYNLGSTHAPETAWEATQTGERIVLDLGESRMIDRVNIFTGVGDGSFAYEISEDGQQWSEPIKVAADTFKAFVWQPTTVAASGQYVRLTVDKPPFVLYEVAVYASGSDIPAPVQSVRGFDLNPETAEFIARIVDEPGESAYKATFMNGTYFDEIYHARTAFEHLHRLEPYEWTHPPLGKLLISVGIILFGMNPFGWRIVGTLFGIAMIPIMYLFGKRLFGKTGYAFVTALLMTLDGLHFVQTRIATIDVYGVFFILLMFYFMYRYCTMTLFSEDWRRTLVPLGLSGLFFGLGAASKWIVFYAGAGLAILFFLWLYLHFREYRVAVKTGEGRHQLQSAGQFEYWQRVRNVFAYRTVVTLAWACVFFLAVPVTIYVLSYVPFMQVPGPGHGLKDVWLYQKYILEYHSKLEGTHPFSSSWWQWPLMSRPVWYYGATEPDPGTISSIVAIGNPLVWWVGFAAITMLLAVVIRKRDTVAVVLVIAFFSQYVPWMFVPRMTFIYHYFAMVPFSIMAIVYFYKRINESRPGASKLLHAYLAAVAVCFALFYPVLSGLTVSRSYAEHMLKWLPGWQFF